MPGMASMACAENSRSPAQGPVRFLAFGDIVHDGDGAAMGARRRCEIGAAVNCPDRETRPATRIWHSRATGWLSRRIRQYRGADALPVRPVRSAPGPAVQ